MCAEMKWLKFFLNVDAIEFECFEMRRQKKNTDNNVNAGQTVKHSYQSTIGYALFAVAVQLILVESNTLTLAAGSPIAQHQKSEHMSID